MMNEYGDLNMNEKFTEKMLNKISNLLDLANNNPNEHEAAAASVKAQELMAKYHIQLADLPDGERPNEEIKTSCSITKGNYLKWRIFLAQVIADNFCCKTYQSQAHDENLNWCQCIMFYGHESDTKIAARTFDYLFKLGNKFADRYYNTYKKEGRPTRGIANYYLMGFVRGIKTVLEKQSTELMIVTPKDVEESFEDMTQSWKKSSISLSVNKSDERAYKEGQRDGKAAIEQTALESK